MSQTYRAYLDPHDAAEYRELLETRDRSIANMRKVSDHRRVELLAGQIAATMQHEQIADGLPALIRVLGHWLRAMPLSEQLTGISIVTHLITTEMTGQEEPPP